MAHATEQLNMVCYLDVDWYGDKIDRRSSTGFVLLLFQAVKLSMLQAHLQLVKQTGCRMC